MTGLLLGTAVSWTNILALVFILNIVFSFAALLFTLRAGDKSRAALHAVFLVGWLGVFALLTGFSIGWLVSFLAVITGAVLTILFPTHRFGLAVATGISVLLALSLRGTVPWAYSVLLSVLVAVVTASIVILAINRKQLSEEKIHLTALSLAGGLSALGYYGFFIIPNISRWIILLSAASCLVLAILGKRYRMNFLQLTIANVLAYLALVGLSFRI